jgi:hypothetical protein
MKGTVFIMKLDCNNKLAGNASEQESATKMVCVRNKVPPFLHSPCHQYYSRMKYVVRTNMHQSVFFPLYIHLVKISIKYRALRTCSI